MILIPNEQLSQYFDLYQLTQTNQPYDNTPSLQEYENLKILASVLDQIYFEISPFTIISAYRSQAVNEAVGGAEGSYHTRGMAADLKPNWPMRPDDFWIRIYDNPSIRSQLGEIALKPTNVHVSLVDPPYKQSVPLIQENGIYRSMSQSEIEELRHPSSPIPKMPPFVAAGATLALTFAISVLIYRLRNRG